MQVQISTDSTGPRNRPLSAPALAPAKSVISTAQPPGQALARPLNPSQNPSENLLRRLPQQSLVIVLLAYVCLCLGECRRTKSTGAGSS